MGERKGLLILQRPFALAETSETQEWVDLLFVEKEQLIFYTLSLLLREIPFYVSHQPNLWLTGMTFQNMVNISPLKTVSCPNLFPDLHICWGNAAFQVISLWVYATLYWNSTKIEYLHPWKSFVSMPFSQMEQSPPSVPSNCGNRNLRNTVNSPYALPSSRVDILRDDLCYKGNTWLQKDRNIQFYLIKKLVLGKVSYTVLKLQQRKKKMHSDI